MDFRKHFYSIFLLALSLLSCKKDNGFIQANKAVVECFLQPGMPAVVKITREIPYNGDSTLNYSIQGLNVSISYAGQSYKLKNDSLGYYSSTSFPILPGKDYNLSFNYNGFDVSAKATIPDRPLNVKASASSLTIPVWTGGFGSSRPTFPDPIQVTWDNPLKDYHYIVIKNIDTTTTEIAGGFRERRFFTSTPDQTNSISLNFNRFRYYGKNLILIYKVQSEYVELYNTVETNSQNLSNVPTNIKNGLGIFTGVNIGDSIFVQVQ